MRLCNVYREPTAVDVLYKLLQSRPVESRISHEVMPSFDDHAAFVRSKPFRMWFLIKVNDDFVGDLHVTEMNEIGVFLFRNYWGNGYGAKAVKVLMARHKPRGAITAKRLGAWVAHISPKNDAGANFFRKLGFKKVEETWILRTTAFAL